MQKWINAHVIQKYKCLQRTYSEPLLYVPNHPYISHCVEYNKDTAYVVATMSRLGTNYKEKGDTHFVQSCFLTNIDSTHVLITI